MATRTRRLLSVLTVLVLALLVTAGTAGTAQAADGYKYWNYFHVTDGKYAFGKTGPAEFTPKDGTVEAYRYGLSSTAQGLSPRAAATEYTVEDICAGTEAEAGQKLVGVLIDYGTPADAEGSETPPEPRAACAAVPDAANGQQVLDSVADVRTDQGLTCGIDGYPVKTCSVTVKSPPPARTEKPVDFALPAAAEPAAAEADSPSEDTTDTSAAQSDDGGLPWPLIGVVAAVGVLGAAAFGLSRRNRSA